MNPDLAAYLGRLVPMGTATAMWGDGTMPLRITGYLTSEPPPLAYVTSARAVVFKGDEVLVPRNRHSYHVVPGGRREAGETPEQTIVRELLEETGWLVRVEPLVAVTHLQHQGPKPEGYPYLYPDFLWSIHVAAAVSPRPGAKLADDYEEEAVFRPIAEARRLITDDPTVLDAAVAAYRRQTNLDGDSDQARPGRANRRAGSRNAPP
jgi:ADP-ribose pyrophosphatase YjhB (NUDIX family)